MPPPNLLRRALLWAMGAAAIVIAALTLSHQFGIKTASREVTYLDIAYPPNIEPVSGLQGGFAISPDGRSVAMIGVRDGARRLYIRRLDRAEATEVGDTPGVNSVFFSPDSASVAFIPGSLLLTRLSLVDQQRAIMASGDFFGNLGWGSEEIVYTRGSALWIVPARGGLKRHRGRSSLR